MKPDDDLNAMREQIRQADALVADLRGRSERLEIEFNEALRAYRSARDNRNALANSLWKKWARFVGEEKEQ